MPEIFTLGYEGISSVQFLRILKSRQIDTLVDVRELPLSRKPGFSKNSLAETCEKAGIQYEHWQVLGCPKDIREAYKADADWTHYTRRFKHHLPTVSDAIEQLSARALIERICLVCFETDPHLCHRSYVAEAAQALLPAIEIIHLTSAGLTVARFQAPA